MRGARKRCADRAAAGLGRLLMLAVLAFLLLPLAMVTVMSLDARSFLGPFPPPGLSLQWFGRFLSEPYYLAGLRTSVELAVLTALMSSAVGLSAALGIHAAPPSLRGGLTALFLSPLAIPGVVVGFALLLFYSRVHLGSTFLRLLGAHVLITVPYSTRAVLATLSGLRPSCVEAALSLGATERRAFWTVTFPLLRTGIAVGAVFAAVFSFDDVAASSFLSDPGSYTLPVALLSNMYANFDLAIAAAAVLQTGATVLLILALDALVGLDRVVGTGLHGE